MLNTVRHKSWRKTQLWGLHKTQGGSHRFVERAYLPRGFSRFRSVRRPRGGGVRSVPHHRVGGLAARHCAHPSETKGCWVLPMVDSS
jgi:hypothetical protein